MSGNVCSYINCHYSSKKFPGLRKFFFPVKEPERLKKWIALCGNSSLEDMDLDRLKRRFLCHKHFEPELMRSNKLLRGSLPFDHSEAVSWASEPRETYSKFSNPKEESNETATPEKDAANNSLLLNNILLHGPRVDHGYVKPRLERDNITAKSPSSIKVSKKNVINDTCVLRKVSKLYHSDDKFTNLKIVGKSPSSGKVVKKRVIVTDPVAVKKILSALHTSQQPLAPKLGTYFKSSTEDGSCEKVAIVEKTAQSKLPPSKASTSRDTPSKDSYVATSREGDNKSENSPSVKRVKERVLDDPNTVKEILSGLYSFQQRSSCSPSKYKTNAKFPKGRVSKKEQTVKRKSVTSNVPKSMRNIPQRRSTRSCVLRTNSKSPSQNIDESIDNGTSPKKNVKRKTYTRKRSPPRKILFKQNLANTLPSAAPAATESSDNLETKSNNKEATPPQGVLERKHSTCEASTQTSIEVSDLKSPAVFAPISGGSASKLDPRFSEPSADIPASTSEIGGIFSESSVDIAASSEIGGIFSEPSVDIAAPASEIGGIFSDLSVDIAASPEIDGIFSEPLADIAISSSEIGGIFSELPADIVASVTKPVSTGSVYEKMDDSQVEETIPTKFIVRAKSLSIEDADDPSSVNLMASSDETYYVVVIVEPQTDSKSPASEENNEDC